MNIESLEPEDDDDDFGPFSLTERVQGYKDFVLIPEIEKMMFVAGETGEPSTESTTLVEQIIHEQCVEIVGLDLTPFINAHL